MHEGVSLGAGGCFIFVPLNKTNVIFKLSFEVWVRTSQRSVFPINSICTQFSKSSPLKNRHPFASENNIFFSF